MLLHHADQGVVEPEVRRPDSAVRREEHRPADGRHEHQRRRARGHHDHRGAAEHAVRGFVHSGRSRVRRDGRGALPRRPVPRPRVGRGHPAPARARAGGRSVRDGQQRRGVRRVAGRGARRHDGRRRRAPAGAAVAAHAGGQPDARPVRGRPDARPDQLPGAAQDRGAGSLPRAVQSRSQPRRGHREAVARQRVQAAVAHGHDPADGRGQPAARDRVRVQPRGL